MPLAFSIASSRSRTRASVTTGPNTSSQATFMSRSTSPSSVGRSSPAASVSPPASSFAPPSTASLTHAEDAVAVALVDHGPDLGGRVERVAGDERLDLRLQGRATKSS